MIGPGSSTQNLKDHTAKDKCNHAACTNFDVRRRLQRKVTQASMQTISEEAANPDYCPGRNGSGFTKILTFVFLVETVVSMDGI